MLRKPKLILKHIILIIHAYGFLLSFFLRFWTWMFICLHCFIIFFNSSLYFWCKLVSFSVATVLNSLMSSGFLRSVGCFDCTSWHKAKERRKQVIYDTVSIWYQRQFKWNQFVIVFAFDLTIKYKHVHRTPAPYIQLILKLKLIVETQEAAYLFIKQSTSGERNHRFTSPN